MIFHENHLLADDSREISYLIFLGKMVQNVLSAAVVIGALRVNSFRNTIRVSNSLDSDQAQRFVGPDLGSKSLQRL